MRHPPIELHRTSNARLWALGIVYLGLFCVLGAGLFYRQVILSTTYKRQEDSQSLRRIIQPGPRGNIYDRKGRLLVGNQARFSLVLYLSDLKESFRKAYIQLAKMPERKHSLRSALRKEARQSVIQGYLDVASQILNRPIDVSPQAIERHFQQRLLLPLPIAENLSLEEFAKLNERLPLRSPLQLYTDSIRYYPHNTTAAHVLGYIAKGQEDIAPLESQGPLASFHFEGKIGKTGLEKSFDSHLRGQSGGEVWRVDPAGFQQELIYHKTPEQGKHLYCSLDLHLQQIAEKSLGSLRGSVVAIEVKTGEVLVMANNPSYDPNLLSTRLSQETFDAINNNGAWLNRAIQGIYPPGSPFKILTALAAFRSGVLEVDGKTPCSGYFQVGNRAFPCLRRWGHGTLDLPHALALSCNIMFYEKSLEMGIDAFAKETKRFGFGEQTGIELPFESKITLVPTPAWKKQKALGSWLGGDTANMSIGQGYLLVTPLQMACFTAAFSLQQTRIQPTILHTPSPSASPLHPLSEPLGLSPAQYQKILEGMELAVQKGTAKRMYMNTVRIASKTGTAQVKIKNGEMHVVWSISFAPIEDPRIAIAVVVEEATEEDHYWGGVTAAPIAGAVIKAYFEE
jgi:penicillin-binding protein 2